MPTNLLRSPLRRRVAGAALVLALIGAVSAGMATSVDRARRKKLPRASEARPRTEEVPARVGETLLASSRLVALPPQRRDTWDPPSHAGPSARHALVKTHHPTVESSPVPVALARATEDGTPEAQARSAMPPVTARIPAPLRVSWRLVESSVDTVRLVARLDRSPGFTAPVEVSLRVPPRAVLREGPTSPIVLDADVHEVPWTLGLAADSGPDEDLVLLASAGGDAFGVHAEARYPFGGTRAEPPRPTPTGPRLPENLLRGRE
ncbi:hypothetical protein GTY96_01900 [Corallococcus sp. c25j21]|nr:hypothetical protein [Corallococcus silvisoli]